MATQGPSPALFFDTISAYQRTEALRAAVELDLFSHVGAGAGTAAEIAGACQASPRGVRILADYLTICGFLAQAGRPLRTHPRLEGLPRPQVARLRGRRDAIHALARPEGELPATDGGRAAGRDGDLRRGHRLPRQPGLGRVRPRDGAAHADARPTPRGPGRRGRRRAAARARRRRRARAVRHHGRRALPPSPRDGAGLAERAGGRRGERDAGRRGRPIRPASRAAPSTSTGAAPTTSCC